MKKFSKIMAICLAFVLTFALAACGNNPEPPDFDSIKGENITDAEAFVMALDFSEVPNFSCRSYTYNTDPQIGQSPKISEEVVFMLDEDKAYLMSESIYMDDEKSKRNEGYVVKDGDNIYAYTQESSNDTWVKTEHNNWVTPYVQFNALTDSIFSMIKMIYDKLKYDDEKSALVYVGPYTTYKSAEWQVKIVDGKLAFIKIDCGKIIVTLQIYNVGKTSVKIPKSNVVEE